MSKSQLYDPPVIHLFPKSPLAWEGGVCLSTTTTKRKENIHS